MAVRGKSHPVGMQSLAVEENVNTR